LRQEIEQTGFSPEQDAITLKAVYGYTDADCFREEIYDSYEDWPETSERSKEEREPEGYAPRRNVERTCCRTSPKRFVASSTIRKNAPMSKSIELNWKYRVAILDNPGLDHLLR